MSHGGHGHGGHGHMTDMPVHTTGMPGHMHSTMDMTTSTNPTANGGGHANHAQAGHLMTFYVGHNLELLFDSWQINTAEGLVGAVFFVFFLAIAYEALKTLREWLLYLVLQKQKERQRQCNCSGAESTKLEAIKLGEKGCECPEEKPSSPKVAVAFASLKNLKCNTLEVCMHILQSFLHVIQIGTGYLLMLVAMTFNGWLFLAVCLGFGAGYFLFAKMRYLFGTGSFRESNECCS